MSRRVLLILLALLLAAGAIFITPMLLRGAGGRGGAKPEAPPHPITQVLVAKSDLYIGDTVKPTDVVWQAWPDGPLPPTYIVQGKGRIQDVTGALVTSRFAPGDPITAGHLSRPTNSAVMAAILRPGDRAVTVNVTASTGMAGFLAPGDRVDVILTQTISSTGPGAVSHHVSETLLHGVHVVGIDQNLSDKKDDKKDLVVPKTATLEVTPKQAEIIAVAEDMGVLTLALDSLAGAHDEDSSERVTRTWDTDATKLFSVSSLPGAAGAPASPTAPTWTVQVIRGATSASMTFPLQRTAPGGPTL
jgi:pilus assembly protein CpaB